MGAAAPFLAIAIDPTFAHIREVVQGAHAWAREHGVAVVHRAPGSTPAALADASACLIQTRDHALRQAFAAARIPAVVVTGRGEPGVLPAVLTDDDAIGQLAAMHLRGLGLRRLAAIGPADHPLPHFARARSAAFAAAAAPWPAPTIAVGDLAAWLGTDPEPAGIFAVTDHLARAVAESAHRLGIAIPARLAVLGVDDDPYLVGTAPLPLSSIRLDGLRQGRLAAELAWRWAAQGLRPDPLTRIAPLGVAIRASTDALHAAQPLLARFLDLLRSEAGMRLGVAGCCRRAGIGQRSAERALRRLLGTSPAAELTRLRMARACDLLLSTDLPAQDVATACGYASRRGLLAAFAAAHGMSPEAWRAAHRR